MNWSKSILPVLFFLCLPAHSGFSQGSAFSYEGRLVASGAPVNGSYDFQFRLFAEPAAINQAGGTVLAPGVQVSNGVFAATVDFGANVFNGSNYWLQVGVRTNGAAGFVTLTPSQALLPTPYAVFANSASNLSGTLGLGQLPGPVVTNNAAGLTLAGNFSGDGSGLTNVAAADTALLGGLPPSGYIQNQNSIAQSASFWLKGSATAASFTGPILDSGSGVLQLRAGGTAGSQLIPTVTDSSHSGIVNLVNGSPGNYAPPGVYGATVSGGGALRYLTLNGLTNRATADFATVGGGNNNAAAAAYATVGGGNINTAAGPNATVAGGNANLAVGHFSAVGGGAGNACLDPTLTTEGGTIAGGFLNTNSGMYASIGGGTRNAATNDFTTIPGGQLNVAGGTYSFAAGRRAKSLHQGAFVWADSLASDFASTANDQFLVRAAGGVGINTSAPQAPLHVVPSSTGAGIVVGVNGVAGGYTALQMDVSSTSNGYARMQAVNRSGATWGDLIINPSGGNVGIGLSAPTTALQVNGTVTATVVAQTSDRNAKENFAEIQPGEVLRKVAELSITRWNFKGEPAAAHVGPMAQDFHSAFGLGTDDKHIATVDADGVALAAIQGLNQRLEQKDRELAEMKQRLERLEKLVAARSPER